MSIESYIAGLSSSGFTPKSILDIGANSGDFSIFCKSVWPNCNILMIEGNDNCENDLIVTGLPYKIALLGDETRKVNFYINKRNSKCTGSSYYKENTHHYDDCDVIEKDLIKLDDLTNESYDIIKIDTQGSEIDVIKGGINVILNSKYVLLEVATKQFNIGSPLFDDVVSYMKSIGFGSYEIVDHHVWPNKDYSEFKHNEIFQVDVAFSRN